MQAHRKCNRSKYQSIRYWQTMADNGRQWQTMADNGRQWQALTDNTHNHTQSQAMTDIDKEWQKVKTTNALCDTWVLEESLIDRNLVHMDGSGMKVLWLAQKVVKLFLFVEFTGRKVWAVARRDSNFGRRDLSINVPYPAQRHHFRDIRMRKADVVHHQVILPRHTT